MEQKRRTTVQTPSDAAVFYNTDANSTVLQYCSHLRLVVEATVYVLNDATVSNNAVPESFL